MTSYEVQCMASPSLNPLFAKDKGDIANRVRCSYAQTKNSVVTLAKAGVVVGGASAIAYAAKKSPKIAEVIGKGIGVLTKMLPSGKIFNVIKNASPKAKFAAAVIGTASTALAYIFGKGIYRMGQIDQQYTDSAKVISLTQD